MTDAYPDDLPDDRLPVHVPLAMPEGFADPELWTILTSVIFPNARDPGIIDLALRYCQKRGLDILKRPVNIVPVWNSQLRRNVETIWPSITETEITAARSGWAGLDAPQFGPEITQQFLGSRKDKKRGWVDSSMTVTFPAYCDRTVHRIVNGSRRSFTERVHWLEAYGRQGGSDLPNYMWSKRPRDQLAKVAKAAALRAAFPEESTGPTGDEADGMIVPGEDITPPPRTPIQPPRAPEGKQGGDGNDGIEDGEERDDPNKAIILPHTIAVEDADGWRPFGEELIAGLRAAPDNATLVKWFRLNHFNLDAMAKVAPKLHRSLERSIEAIVKERGWNTDWLRKSETMPDSSPPPGAAEYLEDGDSA